MEDTKHPYAEEWSGSHTGTSENGIPYHLTCSERFRNDPKAMQAIKQLIEKAISTPVKDLKRDHPDS